MEKKKEAVKKEKETKNNQKENSQEAVKVTIETAQEYEERQKKT